jgi:formate C-acetyltransferase
VDNPWYGFHTGRWQSEIDVRGFIVANTKSYSGDEAFPAPISQRTQAVWSALQPYFREEMTKGVLDADASTPSPLLSHTAGYIDVENEVIVGLQTDKPFRRAIMPYGGLRMVENGVKAAGIEADTAVHEAFTRYRRTHNDGVFDAYTPEIMAFRSGDLPQGHQPGPGADAAFRRAARRDGQAGLGPFDARARTHGRSRQCGRKSAAEFSYVSLGLGMVLGSA